MLRYFLKSASKQTGVGLTIICIYLLSPGLTIAQGSKPAWIDRQLTIPYKINGVGSCSAYSTADSNRTGAIVDARKQLAMSLQVSIVVHDTISSTYSNIKDIEDLDVTAITNVQQMSNVKIFNNQIGETWLDKKTRTYFAYVYIDDNDFINEMSVFKNDLISIINKGDEAVQNRNIIKALREYTNGINKTKGIHPSFLEAEIDNAKGYLPTLFQRKIESILENFDITYTSDSQSGLYDSALPQPLTIKVKYNENVIPDIPVLLEFSKGAGVLNSASISRRNSITANTNRNGNVKFNVDRVLSVTRNNIITATVDLQSILSDGWDEYISRFKGQLTAQYVFSSEFTPLTSSDVSISIEGSSDEQVFQEGKQAEIKVTVDETCCLNIFLINVSGELTCISSGISILNEQTGEGWKIEKAAGSWSFRFDTLFNTDSGEGVETIVCVKTPLGKSIGEEDRKYSKDELMKLLDSSIGRNNYQINTLSYTIRK